MSSSESIFKVRQYFEKSEPSCPVDEHYWHEQAVENVTAPIKDRLLPRLMGAFALELFKEFPFHRVPALLSKAPESKKNFRELRQMRKILTVARDTLNLSNSTDLIEIDSTEPLRSFIMSIGVVSDTLCQDEDAIAITIGYLGDATDIAYSLPDEFLQPVDLHTLRQRLQEALASDILLNPSIHHYNEEGYHVARQSLRSVVYAGIVRDALDPSAQRERFLLEGLHINRIHGDIRNNLKYAGIMSKDYTDDE